jgi:hypothetical protein
LKPKQKLKILREPNSTADLIVTAGTIILYLPRRAIPSVEIPAWLELRGQVDPDQ